MFAIWTFLRFQMKIFAISSFTIIQENISAARWRKSYLSSQIQEPFPASEGKKSETNVLILSAPLDSFPFPSFPEKHTENQ